MARLGGRAINPGMESGRRFLCVLVHVWRRSEGKLGENRGDEDGGVGWALELTWLAGWISLGLLLLSIRRHPLVMYKANKLQFILLFNIRFVVVVNLSEPKVSFCN
jgi:hypothetical protein